MNMASFSPETIDDNQVMLFVGTSDPHLGCYIMQETAIPTIAEIAYYIYKRYALSCMYTLQVSMSETWRRSFVFVSTFSLSLTQTHAPDLHTHISYSCSGALPWWDHVIHKPQGLAKAERLPIGRSPRLPNHPDTRFDRVSRRRKETKKVKNLSSAW